MQMREAFEVYIKGGPNDVVPAYDEENNCYHWTVVNDKWRCWQAAWMTRPEERAVAAAIAMEGQPTIKEAVMRVMKNHYWDSLEPQKKLILLHIEGALRWLGGTKS